MEQIVIDDIINETCRTLFLEKNRIIESPFWAHIHLHKLNQPFKGGPIAYWAYHKESFSILNLIEETFHILHVDFQNFFSFRLFVN